MSSIVVMADGGLESAIAALIMARNKDFDKIHLHHIRMLENETKERAAWQGFCGLYNYLTAHFDLKFDYSVSAIDFSCINIPHKYLHYCGMIGRQLNYQQRFCGLYPLLYIVMGNRTFASISKDTIAHYFNSVHWPVAHNYGVELSIPLLFPVANMNIETCLGNIPSVLDSIIMPCDSPLEDDKFYTPCLKCKECLAFKKENYSVPKIKKTSYELSKFKTLGNVFETYHKDEENSKENLS